MMCLICLVVRQYTSVIDQCVNPPFTSEMTYYLEYEDNLNNLTILVSVVSGSIRFEQSGSEKFIVKVIRGASNEEALFGLTNFYIEQNSSHVSLMGKTPSTLVDCPTVQIIVQVPQFYNSYMGANKWQLEVETGSVHISEFNGRQSDMQIQVSTGRVQIDGLQINNLEVVASAGAIYWGGEGEVLRHAKFVTDAGYIKVQHVHSVASLQFLSNTGMIDLHDIATKDKVEVNGSWGIIHLSDVNSPGGVTINSDSAFVNYENVWEVGTWKGITLTFQTSSGSLDLNHLDSGMWYTTQENGTQKIYFNGPNINTYQYNISTVSGIVRLSHV